ncbi:beta-L-arabinofuranosidase domain-containing protein [Actinoplanes sp. NPDC026670]|uniref:beta-L-arabinofuranosidase domain-containing protein n=1 Tax=Actinoplanes sp. NPDC026670 TaxID=3154700 RepID=UPI003410061A
MTLVAATPANAELGPGLLKDRFERNLTYMTSLTPENLLRPYQFEAGLWSWCGTAGTTIGATVADGPDTWHWGWEAPTSQLRGHILGHWLSAAAHLRHASPRIGATADHLVAELARCQQANGGEWIAPFPEKHLERIAAGQTAWAPQYVLHKLLAGLLDMAVSGHNTQALEILTRAAKWFSRWTAPMSREQLDDILDVETGGMLEVWASLFQLTGDLEHQELVLRYRRGRFFDRLLAGDDVLTNKHANTQVAEILGCARAYEVTGDPRWRDIVEAFWHQAVTGRGTYVTGGSSSGEIWQPPGEQAARLHDVQEHCVVTNMMRLADYLYRWTGEAGYAAYWESNLINGVLAQQHPETGMVAYFLPLEAGSTKVWGHPTRDFWCCHGTLLQAHTLYPASAAHLDGQGIRIGQYTPSTLRLDHPLAGTVEIEVTPDVRHGVVPGRHHSIEGYESIQLVHTPGVPWRRPRSMTFRIRICCAVPALFTVRLRVPQWASATTVTVNGGSIDVEVVNGFIVLDRAWSDELVDITLATEVTAHPLPDEPGHVAFTDGPIVLAGLVGEERTLRGDPADAAALLRPDRERHHSWWNAGTYRTHGQNRGIRFIPLYDVTQQEYTVYFPVSSAPTE